VLLAHLFSTFLGEREMSHLRRRRRRYNRPGECPTSLVSHRS